MKTTDEIKADAFREFLKRLGTHKLGECMDIIPIADISSCDFDKQIKLINMENQEVKQKLNNTDEQLLISAVMSSTFFKEHLRKAWSNGRMFDMEQYKSRSVDVDIKDVPDKALKFEEWFSRYYS